MTIHSKPLPRAAPRAESCLDRPCADRCAVAGGEARGAGGHYAGAQSSYRRNAGASGVDSRGSRPIHGVSHRDFRRLAPDAARGAGDNALRKYQPGARGPFSGRRSSSAHVLSRAHHRRELAAPFGRVLRLHARPRRGRVPPDLPYRHRDRCDHDGERRWSFAERSRAVVALGRSHGLRLDAPQRRRPGHLHRRSEGSRDRPAPADPRRRRLGRPGLVARRHEARGARVRLDQRELSVGRGRGDRREDARHAEGEG